MKNRIFFLITALTFFSVFSYSQTKMINGIVKNMDTKELIPYVNIGVYNKRVGTISSIDGKFSLKIIDEVKGNDTITLSHLGFESTKILVSEFNSTHKVVFLKQKTEELEEVVVHSKSFLEHEKIGRSKKGSLQSKFYSPFDESVNDKLGREQGMRLKIKSNCIVEDLNFYISTNNFNSIKFRLNFYKIENGYPTELIIKKDIVFEVKNGVLGWFKYDLKPYNIYFERKINEVAVTIQWIESDNNNKSSFFGISAVNSFKNTFFREKGMDRWAKWNQNLSFYLNAKCEK